MPGSPPMRARSSLSPPPAALWPHRRRFHCQSAGAPHEIELERDILRCPVGVRFGAHPDHAVAQAALQRAERLSFQAVERIAGRMTLRDRIAGQALAPIVIVALTAGETELALAAIKQRTAGVEKLDHAIRRDADRDAARLPPHVGGEREQLLALVRERWRLLLLGAADIDALLEINRPAARRIKGRITRGNAFHARPRVAVAVGARLVGRTRLGVPQRLAVEHPERARVGGVVVLHRLGLAAHEVVSRAALAGGNLGGKCRRRRAGERGTEQQERAPDHSTVIVADSVTEKPLSPVHVNSSLPLSVATVWKVMNGLAAIAACSSALKISSPL